ncbi:glycosyl hydrolase family 3 N terminal domain-containing protein [Stachybotrys elegans]|uniref:beta-glucosidase n=1 Tax=Stachybotrys elegans TaxID=80388 RepID=A0A8K0SYC8_9HYPO|nr:glycosyl hydrolase family 3 N terminal domain-containing protein [Stachybotrys elegans]
MKFSASTLLLSAQAAAAALNNGTNPSEVPYYGLSPPVYPAPVGNGTSDRSWAKAYKKAKALTAQFTLEEKMNVTNGFEGLCVGNTGAVPRFGIPSLCFADAPDGVRGQEFVSAFPAGLHLAATFNKDLMYKYGKALGEEYYGKGIHVALGPSAGPMGRVMRGGRNWEGLSPDPSLAAVAMGAITRGIQDSGVIATAKHWLLNEQEARRRPSVDESTPERRVTDEAISSNADDRTIHELYAFPFMNALKEGAGSVMCSYQRANHSYACQNSKLMNGILKTQLGFEGFVVSDWRGQRSGVASANAGLDVVMPDHGFWGEKLVEAVNNGSVSEERMTDMATRVLATWYYLEQENNFPETTYRSYSTVGDPVNVQADHSDLIREIGAAGTVLVKNVNKTLPLKDVKMVSVYGYDATVPQSPWQNPNRYGGGYEVNFGWNTFNGTLVTGGGSGISTPPYVVSPFHAISDRIAKNKGTIRWDFYSEAPGPHYVNTEACLVFINGYASESFDRVSLTDEFSDNLVINVASMCPNTIVTMHHTGARTVDAWIDHPNVTAVIYGGLPGQESGNSLADVLFGDVNPTGKLPFTIAKKEEDYGELLNSTNSKDFFPEANFTEGLYIDYRYFDKKNITPLYEFGFGLSYTTFGFSNLETAVKADVNMDEFPDPEIDIIQGGHPELWDVVATVKAHVENTGDVDGAEIAQLYIGVPGDDTPARQLRGFERVGPLVPGQNHRAVFELTRRDLSTWDVEAQQWRFRRGTYKVYVGSSSRKLPLEGTITIE